MNTQVLICTVQTMVKSDHMTLQSKFEETETLKKRTPMHTINVTISTYFTNMIKRRK